MYSYLILTGKDFPIGFLFLKSEGILDDAPSPPGQTESLQSQTSNSLNTDYTLHDHLGDL